MNRNILLFVCVCLGAGLLVVRFNRPKANPVAAPTSTALEPANDLPVSADSSAGTAGKVVFTSIEPDLNAIVAAEAEMTNAPAAEQKDKFDLLRELSAWASRDPEGALTAMLSLPEGDVRNEALTAACFGLARNDPAYAVEVAQALHLDEQPTAVMEDLVQQWAAADLNSSLAWATNQAAGAPRDEYTARIAFVMSQTTPAEAATLVMDQLVPGPARDEAIMMVLHQWANQNLVAATTWANEVAIGPLHDRVMNELNGIIDSQRALSQP